MQEAFKEEGHTITFDWTQTVEQHGNDGGLDPKKIEFRRDCAEKDMKGVLSADAVVMIAHPRLCGTLIEVGMAIAWDIPVFILGELERNSVFFSLPRIEQIPEAIDFVSHVKHNYRLLKIGDGPPVA